MKTAVVTLLLALLAAWAAWPRSSPGKWRPYSEPDLVEVVALDDVNVASNLVAGAGRLHAQRELDLVFRRCEQPRQVSLAGREGRARLFLGDDGPALTLQDSGWTLEVGKARTPVPLPAGGEPRGAALRCHDGRLAVIAAGETLLEQAWVGDPPSGRVGVRLAPRASFESLTLEAEDGPRTLDAPAPEGGWGRLAWAVAAMLLLVPALASQRPQAPVGTAGRTLLAAVSAAALAAGLAASVSIVNSERMAAPDTPCETQGLERPEPTTVDLFHPLEVPRRIDGDFRLEADVTLAPDSVLDVLVRGAPVDMDRGLVVTLSSDAQLAGGAAVNLSVEWQPHDAPAEFSPLAPGRPWALAIEAEGAELRATLDGRPFARASCPDLRAGRSAFHVLTGRAEVANLRIVPLGSPRELTGLLVRWLAIAAGGTLALAGALSLLGRPRSGAGLALAPLAVACWPPAPGWLLPFGAVSSTALLLAWAPAGRRLAVLVGAGAVAGLCFWALGLGPPDASPAALNQLQVTDVRGGPVPGEFLWARHPLVRRFSPFVRDHIFRSGPVHEPRDPGSFRIVALGSSSTFGYGVGADRTWSAFLQRRLGNRVEVINAGVPGASAERLRWFVAGVVAPLRPDLVIVDLAFNDHIRVPQYPERAYFEAFIGDGVGWLDQLGLRWRAYWRTRDWNRYFQARVAGSGVQDDAVERFEVEPVSRFRGSLRDIAESCRALGSRVVFVAEPARDQDPVLAAFQAGAVTLGQELGIPVVSPQADLDALGEDDFLDVVHPTEAGHHAIGVAILEALVREGGVPAPR